MNKGKKKAGPPWRGVKWRTRLNKEIVTSCSTLINPCIYRKMSDFYLECFSPLRCPRAARSEALLPNFRLEKKERLV